MMVGFVLWVVFFMSSQSLRDDAGIARIRAANAQSLAERNAEKITKLEGELSERGTMPKGSDLQPEIKTDDPIGDPSEGSD